MNRLDRRPAHHRPRRRVSLERLEWRLALSGISPLSLDGPPPIVSDLDDLGTSGINPPMLGGPSLIVTGLDDLGPLTLPEGDSPGPLFLLDTPPSDVAPLSVVATDPSDGSMVVGSLTTLTIQFDRPLDPFSLGIDDVMLDQVASDGSLSPVFGPLATWGEALDPTGTELLVTPPAPLDPGSYQLFLSANSTLSGLDGSMPAVSGDDQRLAEFAISAAQSSNPGTTVTGGSDGPPVVIVVGPGSGGAPGTIINVPGGDDGSSSDPQPSTLSIVATVPAAGSVLDQAPATLTVQFDRQLSPSTLTNDLILDRVGDDGQTTPVFDESHRPPVTLDPTGTSIVLTLPDSLGPGHYRIVLSGDSTLTGTDGSTLASAGTDLPLGDFTIARQGAMLADADDLGVIGVSSTTTSGMLDLAADPTAVHLYKITLPAGNDQWRLGIEVDAQRIGSPLDSALTLFDAQGHPIATDDSGRPDAPNDPYLFAGLAPGTYYVGVSGHGNLPGTAGGYNPATADPGSIAATGPGGAYTLRIVADPAPAAPKLIGFTINRADPLDPTPTGMTLQFSDAIRAGDTGLAAFNTLSAGLVVVDASGRSWPVAAVDFDSVSATITYLFRDRLPEGQYTVRLPANGGLTDLIGQAPLDDGLPAGELGTFAVAIAPSQGPNDLGALTPNLVLAGIDSHATLGPGESMTYRFVNPFDDFYQLAQKASGGPLAMDLVRVADGSTTALDAGPVGSGNSELVHLQTGEYLLRLTNASRDPIEFDWNISIKAFSWEVLIANGLGQGPALNLRLIAPEPSPALAPASPTEPSAPSTAPGPESSPDVSISISIPVPAPAAPAPAAPAPASPAAPEGSPAGPTATSVPVLNLAAAHDFGPVTTFGGGLVGRSGPGPEASVSAGPAFGAPIGSVGGPGQALAGPSIPTSMTPDPLGTPDNETHAAPAEPDSGAAPVDGALIAGAFAPEPDPKATLDLGWLGQLRPDWLTRLVPAADHGPEFVATSEPPTDLTADDLALESGSGGLEQAGLTSPVQIGLGVLLVVQSRHLWHLWRRGRAASQSPASAPRVAGPHAFGRPRRPLGSAAGFVARAREPRLEISAR